jgi:hypothetical protein
MRGPCQQGPWALQLASHDHSSVEHSGRCERLVEDCAMLAECVNASWMSVVSVLSHSSSRVRRVPDLPITVR